MPSPRRTAACTAAAAAVVSDGPVRFTARLAALPRLVRDVLRGRWDGVSRGRLAVMAVAVVYVVSPVDLLPEAILTIPGLADDAMVVGWLVTALLGATTAYLGREGIDTIAGTNARVVPAELVTR